MLLSLNKQPEHDPETFDEIKELSTQTLLNSLEKMGQYQFVHNENNMAMRKSVQVHPERQRTDHMLV